MNRRYSGNLKATGHKRLTVSYRLNNGFPSLEIATDQELERPKP